jgi:YesN/AraC family two-component response regulator
MPELKMINMDHTIRILIVDDDKVIADILKDLVSTPEQERSVSVCYDGSEAIDRLRNGFFDLIITDLKMPITDGMEVLRFAKKMDPAVLVIIVTGYASLETAIIAIKEGAYDYIMKPCKLDEIKIVVNRAIDTINLNRENKELLRKLQGTCHELMVLNKERAKTEKMTSLNFFSSSMAGLHYLYNNTMPDNYADNLQTLSSLKEKGMLTESEFKAFKIHCLNMLNTKAGAEGTSDE